MDEIQGVFTSAFRVRHHENTDGSDLPLLTVPAFEKTGMVVHGFSTRIGGVSEDYFAELNLKFGNGDLAEHVMENYSRLAEAFGIRSEDFVFTDQTHTTNVRVVTRADAGAGLTRPQDQCEIDGLVTNEPGIMLSAFFADCVPLMFLDPVHRAIGVAHSGWRGTVGRMGAEMIRIMRQEYQTDPKDLLCAIGPSICQSCYEVSEDVAGAFREEFSGREQEILRRKGQEKYLLDLWEANRIVLEEAGVSQGGRSSLTHFDESKRTVLIDSSSELLAERITVTDLCTCCHPKLLFSHRATHGKRGNLGAFLMLKDE